MSAQKQKSKTKINLLPQKGLTSTTAGRILVWILSTFRIIVIVTELMVMVAFLSRFWLDAENTDLSEEIAQKQAVLAASQGFERKFKETQAQLAIFSELTAREELFSNVLDTTRSSLPDDLFLTSLTFSEQGVTIESATPNERSIQQLLVNLSSKELFKEAQLVEVGSSKDDSSLLKSTIKVILESKTQKL
jgi:Tfp pilus assembly protein PilN